MKKWNLWDTFPVWGCFLIMYLTSSFVVLNDILSNLMTQGLWLVVLGFGLLRKPVLKGPGMLLTIVMAMCMVLTTLINDESMWMTFNKLFAFGVAFVYFSNVDFDEFVDSFSRIMLAVCVVSLVGFASYHILPSLKRMMVVRNAANRPFSCLFFYVFSLTFDRNMGLFWEPGAFATFIGLAMLLESRRPRHNIVSLIVYCVTMVTTFSTTGYIAMLLMLLIIFMQPTTERRLKYGIAAMAIAGGIMVLLSQDVLMDGSTSVFGKLNGLVELISGSGKRVSGSASTRFYSFVKPLEEFAKSPLFGVGYQGLNTRLAAYTRNMNTCTFVNWFAVYGVVFGGIMLTGYGKLAARITASPVNAALILGGLFLLTCSENYVQNAFFYLMALYGFDAEAGKVQELRDEDRRDQLRECGQHG